MMTRRTRSGLGRFWKGRSHREGVESTVLPHEYQMLAHRGDPRAQEPETLRRPTHPSIPWHAHQGQDKDGQLPCGADAQHGSSRSPYVPLAGKRRALDAPPRQALSFRPSRSFGKAPLGRAKAPHNPLYEVLCYQVFAVGGPFMSGHGRPLASGELARTPSLLEVDGARGAHQPAQVASATQAMPSRWVVAPFRAQVECPSQMFFSSCQTQAASSPAY